MAYYHYIWGKEKRYEQLPILQSLKIFTKRKVGFMTYPYFCFVSRYNYTVNMEIIYLKYCDRALIWFKFFF